MIWTEREREKKNRISIIVRAIKCKQIGKWTKLWFPTKEKKQLYYECIFRGATYVCSAWTKQCSDCLHRETVEMQIGVAIDLAHYCCVFFSLMHCILRLLKINQKCIAMANLFFRRVILFVYVFDFEWIATSHRNYKEQ